MGDEGSRSRTTMARGLSFHEMERTPGGVSGSRREPFNRYAGNSNHAERTQNFIENTFPETSLVRIRNNGNLSEPVDDALNFDPTRYYVCPLEETDGARMEEKSALLSLSVFYREMRLVFAGNWPLLASSLQLPQCIKGE